MFVYECHIGSYLFPSEKELDWEELYCEGCGDSDRLIGEYDDPYQFFEDFKEEYDAAYLMRFIEENFNVIGKGKKVFLVCQDKDSEEIFVCFGPDDYAFGTYHQVPSNFSLNKKYDETILSSIMPWVEETHNIEKLYENDKNILYQVTVTKDEDDKEGAASYIRNGWYGYISIEEYQPLPRESWIKEKLIKRMGKNTPTSKRSVSGR